MRIDDEPAGAGGYDRDEAVATRLDRNYAELLQELRVVQNGVQILFAFLLGIAFQQRFSHLADGQKVLYLVTLVSAATSAVLLIAPAAAHRVLFHRHQKDEVVALTSQLASVGLVFLAVSVLSAVGLVLDFVADLTTAIVVASVLGLVVATTWVAIPFALRRRPERGRGVRREP